MKSFGIKYVHHSVDMVTGPDQYKGPQLGGMAWRKGQIGNIAKKAPKSNYDSSADKFLQRWAQDVRQEAKAAVGRLAYASAPRFSQAEIAAHRARQARD